MKRARTVTEIVLACALTLGCGSAAGETTVPSGPLESEQGLYVADLSFDPNPPGVGENSLGLWLEAEGQPVADASVEVEAYMPAHGHMHPAGAMVALEAGSYRSDHVVYNMPGTWQLTLKISAASGSDQVVVDYDVR